MRKTLSILVLVMLSVCVFPQKGKKNIQLISENDTISYSYGISMTQQGLTQFLQQQGLLSDTAAIRQSYDSKIQGELDRFKKNQLEKEMNFKLDSVTKANKVNIAEFIEGINAVMGGKDKKAAYKEGLSIGGQLSKMIPSFSEQLYGSDKKNEVSTALFMAGLRDALENNTPLVENAFEIVNDKMQSAQKRIQAEKDVEMKKQYSGAIAAGERFLAENKAKEGVFVTPSGLQYKIIKEGNGPKPSLSDKVKVHYRGSLIDGTVFDSSVERGEPLVFGVGQVIAGWTEALQLMPVGSKWMLYIPYELGYGSREAGQIKPFSTLIFEVELLDIEN